MKSRIILAGGTGFIGQQLSAFLLAHNYEIVVLTRSPSEQRGNVRYANWDGNTVGEWAELLDGAASVINLAGRGINCRHTPEHRREILESRVQSVRVLSESIARCTQPPQSFIQAGAVGIYGDANDRWCDESAPKGSDFVAQVCRQWEEAFDAVSAPGMRKVLLRLGIVLGPNGGFLKVLSRLTRCFLGGQIGNGRQYISWIHITDLARMLLCAVEREQFAGVFNATSPAPVTNAEFMRELRRALHRPWSPPVPEWAARLGSWVLGTEPSLAFISQRCVPRHFLEKDFSFEFQELRPALANIFPD